MLTPATRDGAPDAPHVTVVGCGQRKLQTTAGETVPARALYTSALFRKALAYAEKTADFVFIASARFGAIEPDHKVFTYDQTLATDTIGARYRWGDEVCGTIAAAVAHLPPDLTILAGQLYAEPILAAAASRGWPTPKEPLRGLPIGRRMQLLTELGGR